MMDISKKGRFKCSGCPVRLRDVGEIFYSGLCGLLAYLPTSMAIMMAI